MPVCICGRSVLANDDDEQEDDDDDDGDGDDSWRNGWHSLCLKLDKPRRS